MKDKGRRAPWMSGREPDKVTDNQVTIERRLGEHLIRLLERLTRSSTMLEARSRERACKPSSESSRSLYILYFGA